MKTSVFFLTAIIATLGGAAMANWEIKVVPRSPGVDGGRSALIHTADKERGFKTVAQAFADPAVQNQIPNIRSVSLQELLKDEAFQNEVFSQLEAIAPEALRAARSSAGNMHNPKMAALHEYLPKAVLATPTVGAISAELARHGLVISRPSFEKFEFRRTDQGLRFHCFLWLPVEPVAPGN